MDGFRVPRSLRTARILAVLGGLIGLHAFYLRRSWQGLLYITLLGLTFVSWDFLPVWLFAGISVAMVILDYLRAEQDIASLATVSARGWRLR